MNTNEWQRQVIKFFNTSFLKVKFIGGFPKGHTARSVVCFDSNCLGDGDRTIIQQCEAMLDANGIRFSEVTFFESKSGKLRVLKITPLASEEREPYREVTGDRKKRQVESFISRIAKMHPSIRAWQRPEAPLR